MATVFQVGDLVQWEIWKGTIHSIETMEVEGEPGPQRMFVVVLAGGTQRVYVPEHAAEKSLRLLSPRQ